MFRTEPLRRRFPGLSRAWRAGFRGLFFLLLCCPSGLVVAQQRPELPGIDGRDDRELASGGGAPWAAIGRVNNTLGNFCTGTLIGPRRVLTAAHCLWNSRTRDWVPACALHFLAGYHQGSYRHHALISSYRVSPGVAGLADGGPLDIGSDWAVLNLASEFRPPGGFIPTAGLAQGLAGGGHARRVVQAGYSRDRPHILTIHRGCRLVALSGDRRLARHRCDATFGDSGSPLLLHSATGYLLVALHVAVDTRRGVGLAVTGDAFQPWIRQLGPPAPADDDAEAC